MFCGEIHDWAGRTSGRRSSLLCWFRWRRLQVLRQILLQPVKKTSTCLKNFLNLRLCESIFNYADSNRDGKLTFNEFFKWYRRGGREVCIVQSVVNHLTSKFLHLMKRLFFLRLMILCNTHICFPLKWTAPWSKQISFRKVFFLLFKVVMSKTPSTDTDFLDSNIVFQSDRENKNFPKWNQQMLQIFVSLLFFFFEQRL